MSDTSATPPSEGTSSPGKRQRGPRRRTTFGVGLAVGLALGVAGGIVVPDLFPAGEPDCTRPQQVTWTQSDDGVRLEVDYQGDGAGGCDANIVFSERPQS